MIFFKLICSSLSNQDFRTILMTPRSDERSSMTPSRHRFEIGQNNKLTSFRKERKRYFPPSSTEPRREPKKEFWEESYRDRAKERREGRVVDDDVFATPGMERGSPGEDEWEDENSKVEETIGLDFALLRKRRQEIELEEQRKLEEEARLKKEEELQRKLREQQERILALQKSKDGEFIAPKPKKVFRFTCSYSSWSFVLSWQRTFISN